MAQPDRPTTIDDVAQYLAQLAPLSLAESWDNVGLLVGDRAAAARRVMTCLTISPPVVAEAVERGVDLIVTHHPLPFQPIKRITADTTAGRMLLDLIAARVAIYSAHTAFDSAPRGINQQIAEMLRLENIRPLQPLAPPTSSSAGAASTADLGSGRLGFAPSGETLGELASRTQTTLAASTVRSVGDTAREIRKVAVACGSGGSFLDAARRRGCDCLITGEANFHACLEAQATGVGLILVGHFASERFAMERLAAEMPGNLPGVVVWASEREQDPLRLTIPGGLLE